MKIIGDHVVDRAGAARPSAYKQLFTPIDTPFLRDSVLSAIHMRYSDQDLLSHQLFRKLWNRARDELYAATNSGELSTQLDVTFMPELGEEVFQRVMDDFQTALKLSGLVVEQRPLGASPEIRRLTEKHRAARDACVDQYLAGYSVAEQYPRLDTACNLLETNPTVKAAKKELDDAYARATRTFMINVPLF